VSALLVIVPSRGRPQNVCRLLRAWEATGAVADFEVAVDDDDPTLERYLRLPVHVTVGPRLGMVGTLNDRAVKAAEHHRCLGFAGDDHAPRTPGWDATITDELVGMGTGFVYGDDLIQGRLLPTAVCMTSDIVTALGYMVPPCLKHMYADNSWLDWGTAIDRIHYLADIIIEHMHPLVGKAVEDEGYRSVWPLMGSDREAYDLYKSDGRFASDVEKLRALL
jgi:hypothetical protein